MVHAIRVISTHLRIATSHSSGPGTVLNVKPKDEIMGHTTQMDCLRRDGSQMRISFCVQFNHLSSASSFPPFPYHPDPTKHSFSSGRFPRDKNFIHLAAYISFVSVIRNLIFISQFISVVIRCPRVQYMRLLYLSFYSSSMEIRVILR